MDGNKTSFYVGASLSDVDVAAAVIDAVIDKFDYQLTYRWYCVERHEYPNVALMETNGVLNADIFIGLLPGRFGMAAELGMAIANKQRNRYNRVILWGPDQKSFSERPDGTYPSIFVAHPDVERIVGEDAAKTVVEYLFGRVDRVLAYP